ncbi:hypothetical protein [Streptomyces sp. NTH33]|uniref:hypothetical protein n=1 Tax=Streptomyces sp. NTH33 TaxID=1735453 RepID=UPI0015E89499|nr:hypothetical protein [Streptomyces sp. NTH33]
MILLWPAPDTAPTAPTSDQIKASARARLDASLKEGRTTRQVMLESGKTPSDELCQILWDRKPHSEQQELRYAMWMHGCAGSPQ